MVPLAPGPGQESVWDYPRPPRVEGSARRVRVVLGGETLIDSVHALRVLETSHPPGWYLPVSEFRPGALRDAPGSSYCEYKGQAVYHDLVGGVGPAGPVVAPAAAWSYPSPSRGFEALVGHVALYPSHVDRCLVDEEEVRPQEGGFYGGWITDDVVGPFKGGPGSRGW